MVFIVGTLFGWFNRVPAYPELGITTMLGDKGAVGIVQFTTGQTKGLPPHANMHVVGGPGVGVM